MLQEDANTSCDSAAVTALDQVLGLSMKSCKTVLYSQTFSHRARIICAFPVSEPRWLSLWYVLTSIFDALTNTFDVKRT